MAKSTGPVLAIGAVTVANRVIFNERPMEWRIPIATGIASMLFSLMERGWEKGAISLAWLALISSMFLRVNGDRSPIENAADWWNRGPHQGGTQRPRPA